MCIRDSLLPSSVNVEGEGDNLLSLTIESPIGESVTVFSTIDNNGNVNVDEQALFSIDTLGFQVPVLVSGNGTINSQDNSENKSLLIKSLIRRVKKNNLKEVIIATSATVEGQTTAHYIEDTIQNGKIKITKLAQGLPVGGEIEQLDDGTLFSAFKNRVPVTDS